MDKIQECSRRSERVDMIMKEKFLSQKLRSGHAIADHPDVIEFMDKKKLK